jgi:hypothetical protein
MSGFVVREELRLHDAAAARTDGILKDEIHFIAAGRRGRIGDMLSYLIADDAHCVSEHYWG